MSKEVQDYLDLITSAFQGKPNFTAVITALVSAPVQIQTVMQSMIPLFDIDVAVGSQLDIIGQWVGVSRNIAIPITGVFFSWDGDFSVGWDFGSWQPSSAPTEITSLPDDAYRTLIRAKIAANRWDGTTTGAYAIWEQVFPDTTILIQDNQDMTYDLAVVGGLIDSLTLALLTGGYIPLKPEGVLVAAYYVSVDTGPVFGWDVESIQLGGWNEASWVREILT
jgi:hypothetical protein